MAPILEIPEQSPQQKITEKVKQIETRIADGTDTPEDIKFLNKVFKIRRLK